MLSQNIRKAYRKIKKFDSYLNYIYFAQKNQNSIAIIQRVKQEKLSYLETTTLCELAQTVIDTEKKQIPGIIIETGCALGGSSIVIAHNKNQNRELFIYDVFGMIPPPSEADGKDVHSRYEVIKSGHSQGLGGELYYGYEENLDEKVRQSFINFGFDIAQDNINLVKGLYENTLYVNTPVALAHIDCDWYSPFAYSK